MYIEVISKNPENILNVIREHGELITDAIPLIDVSDRVSEIKTAFPDMFSKNNSIIDWAIMEDSRELIECCFNLTDIHGVSLNHGVKRLKDTIGVMDPVYAITLYEAALGPHLPNIVISDELSEDDIARLEHFKIVILNDESITTEDVENVLQIAIDETKNSADTVVDAEVDEYFIRLEYVDSNDKLIFSDSAKWLGSHSVEVHTGSGVISKKVSELESGDIVYTSINNPDTDGSSDPVYIRARIVETEKNGFSETPLTTLHPDSTFEVVMNNNGRKTSHYLHASDKFYTEDGFFVTMSEAMALTNQDVPPKIRLLHQTEFSVLEHVSAWTNTDPSKTLVQFTPSNPYNEEEYREHVNSDDKDVTMMPDIPFSLLLNNDVHSLQAYFSEEEYGLSESGLLEPVSVGDSVKLPTNVLGFKPDVFNPDDMCFLVGALSQANKENYVLKYQVGTGGIHTADVKSGSCLNVVLDDKGNDVSVITQMKDLKVGDVCVASTGNEDTPLMRFKVVELTAS